MTQLSPKQQAIAEYVARGYSDREIAAIFHISVGTVKTHVRAILGRTDCRDRLEFTVAYWQAVVSQKDVEIGVLKSRIVDLIAHQRRAA